jgi:hypothetical protein
MVADFSPLRFEHPFIYRTPIYTVEPEPTYLRFPFVVVASLHSGTPLELSMSLMKKIQSMKTIYTLFILLSLSAVSHGQHYIYIAKANGNFGDASTWNAATRNDNVKQDKYVIPAAYTVTADKNTDYTTLGDIQLVIAGELQLGPSAEMNLTNNSSIQLLAGASVNGNGGSQKILIGGVTKYQGNKDRTIAGPLFADRTTTGFSLFTTLSVHFVSFTASKNSDNTATLKWSTAEEVNNSHFEIEFSSNGRDWSKIGVVKADTYAGTINNYSFLHKNVNASASYRIRQVDKDGIFMYTDVAVIKNQSAGVQIYAVNKTVTVELNTNTKSNLVVKVLNANGQLVKAQSFSQVNGKVSLSAHGLNNGNYIVQVSDNDNLQSVKSLMIF